MFATTEMNQVLTCGLLCRSLRSSAFEKNQAIKGNMISRRPHEKV